MHRSGPTARDDRDIAHVEASGGKGLADLIGHERTDRRQDRLGALDLGHPKRLGDPGPDRLCGQVAVQRDLAAEEVVGVDVPEEDVGIGGGRGMSGTFTYFI